MSVLKKKLIIVIFLFVIALFSACNVKKKPLADGELTGVKDLIDLFPKSSGALYFGDKKK